MNLGLKIEECNTAIALTDFLLQPQEVLLATPFGHIIEKALEVGVRSSELADALDGSTAMIERWGSGLFTPHDLMRSTTFKVLLELLSRMP
jgi:hypothetical protein